MLNPLLPLDCEGKNGLSNPASRRERFGEVGGQEVEVDRIHRPTVIEITLTECLVRLSEVGCKNVEVDGVYGAIMIGVGGEDEEIQRRVNRLYVSGLVAHTLQ